MEEIKWDIKRGAEIYRVIYGPRLQKWILTGRIKRGDVLVWRSGFSGWRKPEELEELFPFFERWEKRQLRKLNRKKLHKQFRPRIRQIKNILIIDDEEDLCALLSETLRRRNYNINIAATRKEALSFLKRETSDLVFLDLKLPDGDGMKLLSRIKKVRPETAVSIISAYGSEERKEEAKKLGADSFIDKPFTEKGILSQIRKLSN